MNNPERSSPLRNRIRLPHLDRKAHDPELSCISSPRFAQRFRLQKKMEQNFSEVGDSPAATDGGNAPVIEGEPESDLEAIREELRKRNEESAN